MKRIKSLLCMSMVAIAPLAVAEEFSNTPKRETLSQAIQFEKYKDAAAEAQAKKDAAEAARTLPAKQKTANSAAKNARKADTASKN